MTGRTPTPSRAIVPTCPCQVSRTEKLFSVAAWRVSRLLNGLCPVETRFIRGTIAQRLRPAIHHSRVALVNGWLHFNELQTYFTKRRSPFRTETKETQAIIQLISQPLMRSVSGCAISIETVFHFPCGYALPQEPISICYTVVTIASNLGN